MEYFNQSSYDWRISQCCQFHDNAQAKKYNFGTTTKTYDFRGLWPSNIGAIDVSYETENAIQEFTVELQVQYWESTGTTS